MKERLKILITLLLVLLAAGCQKVVVGEEDDKPTGGEQPSEQGNLVVNVSALESCPLADVNTDNGVGCTHLIFAVYDQAGVRLEQVNQKVGDKDFGRAGFHLENGYYQVVVLGHSSSKNPTMTNLSKIQFSNTQGYSDTFLCYQTLSIEDEPQTLNPTLNRIVALCRFVINDPLPENVARVSFVYKGGSGHFTATTGLGVTNSTQTVTYSVQPGRQYTEYDLYSFLHAYEGTIKLTVTALDAADEAVCEREIDVPMKRNQLTWLAGTFFSDSSGDSFTVSPNHPNNSFWGSEVLQTY